MVATGLGQSKAQMRLMQTVVKQLYPMVIGTLWSIYLLNAIE